MKPLIETHEEAARLREIALSWIGTPWVADGAVKGTGASCSMLPYAVLAEFGHEAPLPPSRQGILKRDILPTMLTWLGEHTDCYGEIARAEIGCGDVLVFDFGIGHLALALGGTDMLHAWQTSGAHLSNFKDAKMASRLLRAWRPFKR